MSTGVTDSTGLWPSSSDLSDRQMATSRGIAPTARPRLLHWPLAAVTVGLTCVGTLMVYSAGRGPTGQSGFGIRQTVFAVIGIVIMGSVAFIDYRRLHRWYPIILGGSFVALVGVLTPLGTEVRGTKGWYRFGGLALQPSEFAKLALIIGLGLILQGPARARVRVRPVLNETATGRAGAHTKSGSGLGNGSATQGTRAGSESWSAKPGVTRFGLSVILLGVAAGLVLLEGESGSVLVFCAIAFGMLATAGTPARYLLLLVVTGVAVVGLAISAELLAPYQVDRFEAFLDPDLDPLGVGYNQQQAITAIGSGGLLGAGLFNGPQTQLGYVPDQHTDFIFAAVAEELGFAGGALILGLQAAILGFVFLVGHDCGDRFGQLLCAGVFSMLAFQVFQNVAMNLRLMPITGISLPFVSYGGSSLITSLVAVGMVQSVAVHRSTRQRR